jgi:hypothetical protein
LPATNVLLASPFDFQAPTRAEAGAAAPIVSPNPGFVRPMRN